jgi:hypothetical protein
MKNMEINEDNFQKAGNTNKDGATITYKPMNVQ